jgi:hypothetical protein
MKTNCSDRAAVYAESDATGCAIREAPEAVAATTTPVLLDLVLLPGEGVEPALHALPSKIEGIVVGRVIATADEVRVAFPGSPDGGMVARSMVDLAPSDRGAAVALIFERGDALKPVVLGKMAQGFATNAPAERSIESRAGQAGAAEVCPVTVTRDGERLVLSAEEEIVLSCGEASITLTRAGKVLLRGEYVSSRATGVNRIQGGSVEIN